MEAMYQVNPPPTIKYEEGNTCVFWDVEDYPIDGRLDSELVHQKIKEDLRSQGYLGNVSIHFFIGKDKTAVECSDEQIKITVLSDGGRRDKYYSMIVHILLWAVENFHPSNIVVLSKNVDESTVDDLEGLYMKGYGILLSNPEPDWLVPQESSVGLFPSLVARENPSGIVDTIAG